ncbi:hypothetical protein FQZ97_871190 [compost metagenome]
MLNDVEQAFARIIILGKRQGFNRASQRGEGVFQLVTHVSRETLNRLDAGIKRIGHRTDRGRQMANLVLAFREIRDFLAAFHTKTHAVCCCGQLSQRACNGGRQKQRQDHHDSSNNTEHAENGHALALHDLVDVVTFSRKQEDTQNGTRLLDWYGDRHHQLPLLVTALCRLRRTGQGANDFLIGQTIATRLLLIKRQTAAIEQAGEPACETLPDTWRVFFDCWQIIAEYRTARSESWRVKRAGIEQEIRVMIVNARARAGR